MRDYRAACLRFLPRGDEAARHQGYELGRRAVRDGVSVLDLVGVHHDVLRELIRTTRPEELEQCVTRAGAFLVEVLSTYDMTQRAGVDRLPGTAGETSRS
jgi:hypothetical protein